MAKKFAARVSKRERVTIDLSERLGKNLFKNSDDKLLKGARLVEMELKQITVREQVRTKFNDASLKELSENIRINGLIQPLVIHEKQGIFTLICGERRFRAMSLLAMDKAPCFIIENKTPEELMAIQFSENSSREELHYIDKADGIYNYYLATKASERQIEAGLGISKSDVHRSLIIAKLPEDVKAAAKAFNIEKYVLLEWTELKDMKLKKSICDKLKKGEISKRSEIKKAIKIFNEAPKLIVATKNQAVKKVQAKQVAAKINIRGRKKQSDLSM